MPIAPNTTCDVYRTGNTPPAAPDIAGVNCHLMGAFAKGVEAGEGDAANTMRFTHIMYIERDTDVRDDYTAGVVMTGGDNVYVPDQNGTRFIVSFVNIRGDTRVVYLQRQLPTWPTNNL
jgi:hypothetical protein